jgi:hypothetical protein
MKATYHSSVKADNLKHGVLGRPQSWKNPPEESIVYVRFMGRETWWDNVVISCSLITNPEIRTLEPCSRRKEEGPPCPTVREDKKCSHANGRGKYYLC